MGYWDTRGLVWGDTPADVVDDAVRRLTAEVTAHNGTRPTKDEVFAIGVDAVDHLGDLARPPTAMLTGLREAAMYFTESIGRKPSRDELVAGLQFSLSIYDDE